MQKESLNCAAEQMRDFTVSGFPKDASYTSRPRKCVPRAAEVSSSTVTLAVPTPPKPAFYTPNLLHAFENRSGIVPAAYIRQAVSLSYPRFQKCPQAARDNHFVSDLGPSYLKDDAASKPPRAWDSSFD